MSSFEVSRTTTISASQETVHALLEDFRRWTTWSPWEDMDPAIQRTYSGATSGVGARYAWKGNRKVGEGSMEITGSAPDAVDIALSFKRPFPADNRVRFGLAPSGAGTEVTWSMTGEQKGLMAVLGKVMPMDRMVGKDFERGLARLKAVAEKAGADPAGGQPD